MALLYGSVGVGRLGYAARRARSHFSDLGPALSVIHTPSLLRRGALRTRGLPSHFRDLGLAVVLDEIAQAGGQRERALHRAVLGEGAVQHPSVEEDDCAGAAGVPSVDAADVHDPVFVDVLAMAVQCVVTEFALGPDAVVVLHEPSSVQDDEPLPPIVLDHVSVVAGGEWKHFERSRPECGDHRIGKNLQIPGIEMIITSS